MQKTVTSEKSRTDHGNDLQTYSNGFTIINTRIKLEQTAIEPEKPITIIEVTKDNPLYQYMGPSSRDTSSNISTKMHSQLYIKRHIISPPQEFKKIPLKTRLKKEDLPDVQNLNDESKPVIIPTAKIKLSEAFCKPITTILKLGDDITK